MAPAPPGEILAFVREKIKKHTEQVNYHIERLETYRAIESGLCETRANTSYADIHSTIGGNEHSEQRGARCRFTPDPEYEEEYIIPEWEADTEDTENAERVKHLGEIFAPPKREEGDDNWKNQKLPAKANTKRNQIAEGHARARAWAAERVANPRVYSSPANLRAVQEKKQEEEQKKRNKGA